MSVPAPCPVCSLPGGFHDRAIHNAHVVPAECLLSGDRRDAWEREEFERRYPRFLAFHADVINEMILHGEVFIDPEEMMVLKIERPPWTPKGILAEGLDTRVISGTLAQEVEDIKTTQGE